MLTNEHAYLVSDTTFLVVLDDSKSIERCQIRILIAKIRNLRGGSTYKVGQPTHNSPISV